MRRPFVKSTQDAYPDGNRFAFSIIDDTDDSRVENTKPMYDLLTELGFKTTKTVWPVDCPEGSEHFFAGHTLVLPEYREFCLELQQRGFEITWHGATMESSRRSRTIRALEYFREVFRTYPSIHANHALNRENIYWGTHRYQSVIRRLANLIPGHTHVFEGEVETSPYFWGDLCHERFKYTRNFAFRNINTLNVDPDTPYQLVSTPYVKHWFSVSDAPDVDAFCALVTRTSLDRLSKQGGACILATHLGKGFVQDGHVDVRVIEKLTYLSRLPGWFVPVSTLLDHLIARGNGRQMNSARLFRLEMRHFLDRILSRLWA